MCEMTYQTFANMHKVMHISPTLSTFGRTIDPQQLDACVRSLEPYGDLAAPEAITRALVAERTGQREQAMFWLKVYEAVLEVEARKTL